MPIDESITFVPVHIAILTITDSRTADEDTSGDRLAQRLSDAGHILVERVIVRDETSLIVSRIHSWIDNPVIDVVLTTGGTGLTGRDVTPEALHCLDGKEIPGFGELFRWLSFQTIGTSTIQSRACAVVARGTYVFALPGSVGAVTDAWDQILVTQLDIRHRPCNFVTLFPRLTET